MTFWIYQRLKEKSLYLEKIGGASALSSVIDVPRLEVSDFSPFVHTSLFKNKEFLQQKYVAEGLSIAQIAEQIVSSKEAVRKALVRFCLPIRQACLPHGRPAQPRFGLSYRRQALINYKPEQRVIDTIVELKSQGMSLRQIARTLSKLKIPTKLSGVAWHPMMVKRVLNYLKKENS